jgi:hypothetical protein
LLIFAPKTAEVTRAIFRSPKDETPVRTTVLAHCHYHPSSFTSHN